MKQFRRDKEPTCFGSTALAPVERLRFCLFYHFSSHLVSVKLSFVPFFRWILLGNSCDILYEVSAKYDSAMSSGLDFKAKAWTKNGSDLQSASFSRPSPSERMVQISTKDVGFTIVDPLFSNSSEAVIQFSSLAHVQTPVLKQPATLRSNTSFQRRWDAIATILIDMGVNNFQQKLESVLERTLEELNQDIDAIIRQIELSPSSLNMQPENPNSIHNVLTIITVHISKQLSHNLSVPSSDQSSLVRSMELASCAIFCVCRNRLFISWTRLSSFISHFIEKCIKHSLIQNERVKHLQSYLFEESHAESESWTQIEFFIYDLLDFASKKRKQEHDGISIIQRIIGNLFLKINETENSFCLAEEKMLQNIVKWRKKALDEFKCSIDFSPTLISTFSIKEKVLSVRFAAAYENLVKNDEQQALRTSCLHACSVRDVSVLYVEVTMKSVI